MNKKIAIFAYNFPHKRTQDFILKLFFEGYKPDIVLAANSIKLNLPPKNSQSKLKHISLIHPEIICDKLNIPYKVVVHNSQETEDILKKHDIEIGIISGSRILKDNIIKSVRKGIINFHPGLIPQVRGLDALEKSILNEVPLGITAHIIDKRIDAGRIIKKQYIPIYQDDTLKELNYRLYETQIILLPEIIKLVEIRSLDEFQLIDEKECNYCPPINQLESMRVIEKFNHYKDKFCNKKEV